ncbi:MAG: hypothetical protein ACJ765_13730, partial [Chloroflexota bacterium]
LEQHARSLAEAQTVTTDPRRGRTISPRVAENGRILLESYRTLAGAIREERSISPAAEWLVDNFHIVDEQIREIRDDLPAHYYGELPKLAGGHLEGYPRVLGIAWAYVAHTDSRFDPDSLQRLVSAYQEVEPLTIGELWAVAISLRIILVENLRRLAQQILRNRTARQRADELADSLLGIGRDSPEAAAASLRRVSDVTLATAGRVQLFQRLRDQDPAATPALGRLEEVLAAQGTTAEETVRIEHQRQAEMNVTVRNVITSMRLISWFDWSRFVESVSLTDEALRAHGLFAAMDFATRDRYRHAIETLARGAGRPELDVAKAAVSMAERAPDPGAATSAGQEDVVDPGYYLMGDGRQALERALNVRIPLSRRFRRAYAAAGTFAYVGTLILVVALILSVPLLLSAGGGTTGPALLVLAILAVAPASDLATSSHSTPTPGCRGAPSGGSSGRSPTRSTAPASTQSPGVSVMATGSSSRGSPRRCPQNGEPRCSSASSPARPGSIRTPPPFRTCTRTCSAREATRARGSTTSTPSRGRWLDECPRTRC